jgi:hypothetical protein
MTDQKQPDPAAFDDDRDPRHESRIREWSFAAFLFGALVFTPPLLLVFDRPTMLFGLPLFYVYLFTMWAVLIAVVRRIAAHGRRPEPERGN